MARTRCTNHCSACGQHFHSVNAFDAHRVGSFSDAADPRRCADAIDTLDTHGRPRFAALTEDGDCRMYVGRERTGVTIWTLAADLAHARMRFSRPGVAPGATRHAAEGSGQGGRSEGVYGP